MKTMIIFVCLIVLFIAGFTIAIANADIPGDVNGDGVVDDKDVTLVLRNPIGLAELTPQQKALADANGDGKISPYDAALLLRYSKGLIKSLPVKGNAESASTNATSPIDVEIQAVEGTPGSSVTVPIIVSDTTGRGIISIEIYLDYDPDILTATGFSTTNTLTSGWFAEKSISSGRIAIVMISLTELSGAGTLVKVAFSVKSSADVGETSVLDLSKFLFNDGGVPVTVSDGLFTVVSSGGLSVTVSLPNGGENIKGGTTYNITWTTKGSDIHHIHLLHSTDGGSTYHDIIANTSNDGSHPWAVPLLDTTKARVKAIAEDVSNSELASDASNSNFTIDSTPPETSVDLTGVEGIDGWWNSDVTVKLAATDSASGVKETKYKINDGSWTTYQSVFTITGSTVYYYSTDKVELMEPEKSVEIRIDKTEPVSTPYVTDDGDCTIDGSKLNASWTASSDPESGIKEYQYAIGRAWGGTDVVGWTSVGKNTQVTRTGLSLTPGQTYYFAVRARNGAGLFTGSGKSDGIRYQPLEIGAAPTSLVFNALIGGDNPNPKTLSITNKGCGTLDWTVSKDVEWLTCAPTSGDCAGETDEVVVSVDIAGLDSETYHANITISATTAINTPRTVPVTLNVLGEPSITLVAPNGGEVIKGGSNYTIKWTSSEAGIHHIHLLYSINSGTTYQDIVANTVDDGSHSWNVPLLDTTKARVKAVAEDGNNSAVASDASDSDFTIDSAPPETDAILTGTGGENGWWGSNVLVTLSATDNLSGVKQINYKINDGSWQTYSEPFMVTGTMVYYYSADNAGNMETEESVEIKIDRTAPVGAPVVTDDGGCTTDGSKLHASWTSLSDPESGVVEYNYAIGRMLGGSDVVGWTSVGNSTQVTRTGLSLTPGQTYYFAVKARNRAGLWSGIGKSDGILYQLPKISLEPTSLVFYALAGGSNPRVKTLSIANPDCGTLNWTVSKDADWLACTPTGGDCTGETDAVAVSVNVAGLGTRTYNANITVSAIIASNTPQTVPVTLHVSETPLIELLAPNGGEFIKGSGSYNIKWISTETGIDHVHLLYSTDSGANYQDIISATENDGIYEWNPVSTVDSSRVRVKAIARDGNNAALSSDASNGDFTIDSTVPVTSISLAGIQGVGDWWVSNVKVVLSATDNLSGVKKITYRINDGSWQTYAGPFVVTGSYVFYRSEDNTGNLEPEKSQQIKIDKSSLPAGVFAREMHLYPGWNLISISLDIGYTDLPLVLAEASEYYTAVWAYDAAPGNWRRYIPGEPFNNLNTIEPGKGYCIFMTDEVVITFIGRRILNTTIQLYKGWNLVGYNSTDPKPRSTALFSIVGKYIYVGTYNNGNWLKHMVYAPNFFNNLSQMEPNMGYWINVGVDCEWTVQP